MNSDSPITPPPELVQQWIQAWYDAEVKDVGVVPHVATQAARWGADQELEACCEVLARELICDGKHVATDLRAVRRPKPPSLKQRALQSLGPEPLPEPGPTGDTILNAGAIERHRLVRRALEALDD